MNGTTNGWMYTCEYLDNPLGVENAAPRFAWRWASTGDTPPDQRAYRIEVVDPQGGLAWDSGYVLGRQDKAIAYAGAPLKSGARYLWRVEIGLDGKEEPVLSGDRYFETGLLSPEDWQAGWIGTPAPERGAVPLIRRAFHLDQKPERARLYLSGLGYAEVSLNGRKPDASRLDPGWTDYAKTVLYRAWDVTDLLRAGENVLCAELGEGWHGLEHQGFMELVQKMPPWLDFPKLLCRLVADDTVVCSQADGQWLVARGPVTANSIYDGERYDARLEKPGWRLPGYQPGPDAWRPAVAAKAPGGTLRCQIMPAIAETQRIRPALIDYPATGENTVVVDLGVNIAGWVELNMKAAPGLKLRLRYAEVRDPDGSVNQANLRGAACLDEYIFGGEETVTWAPRFTYHGFRYVQIDYDPGVVIYGVTGVCVHTALDQAGGFDCANRVLRDSYRAVLRTERNNLHSVPTDCPQRDERLGWMNDAAVRCEEAIANFDILLFYEKWMRDICDAQDPATGAIPDTAPYFFGGHPGSHPTSTFVLLPWYLYLYYGDSQPMARHYQAIRRYVEHKLSTRTSQGILTESWNFGDWAAPMTVSQLGWGLNAVPANINHAMLTTGYLYLDCLLMGRFAEILSMREDQRHYAQMAEEVKAAINRNFLNEEGYYSQNAQGENAFALYLNLMPSELRPRVLAHLLEDLREERNWHVTTGNQMTKYLFEVLGSEGLAEDAMRVAASEDYPSIGYMLKNGATTIWERWENLVAKHMNSHDHPMLGAYSVWFQKYLCGIRMDWSGSEGITVRVAPIIPEGLQSARASLRTPEGQVDCAWTRKDEVLRLQIDLPWNARAELTLPALPMEEALLDGAPCGPVARLNSGRHMIALRLDSQGLNGETV